MPKRATRANGYHDVDAAYERSFEAYSRRLKAPLNRERASRSCGCVQNFTFSNRCANCPAVKGPRR